MTKWVNRQTTTPRITAAMLFFAAFAGALLAASPIHAEGVSSDPTYEVMTLSEDWVDPARDGRSVPIKAYLPINAPGARPVIIFSHGLGGSRDGYSYLGEYWASHGYVSVHIQHLGSDDAVWRDKPLFKRKRAMRRAITVLDNSLNRPADVSFTLDRLEKLNADPASPWYQRLDLKRIGMAGHSYGAFTTMAIAGQAFVGPDGRSRDLADPRVKAAIAMSSQAPRDPDTYDESYAGISIPIFHMTGTKDTSPVGLSKSPADRRVAYDHTPGPADGGPDTYLLTFTGGDHMIFSGRKRGILRRTTKKDKTFQRHIRQSSLVFWDAYLNDDKTSRDRLRGGGLRDELEDAGVFEVKP
jgi:dienelactone hydrolase